MLLREHVGERFAFAEHLLVFGAVHHGADHLAPALRGPRHQFLEFLLALREGPIDLLGLQTVVILVLARRDPNAVAELLAHRRRAAGQQGEQRDCDYNPAPRRGLRIAVSERGIHRPGLPRTPNETIKIRVLSMTI